MLLLVMILVLLTPAIAEGYTVIDTPLFRETLTAERLPLRYYDDMPNVPYMGLSLTYDHRALDGGEATRFLKQVATEIENLDIDF